MQFNFSQTLKKLDGDHVTPEFMQYPPEGKEDADKEKWQKDKVTLATVVTRALLEYIETEGRDPRGQVIPKKETDKAKFDKFEIAEKIYSRGDNGLVKLTPAQIEIIKHAMHIAYRIEVMGIVWRILEEPVPEPVAIVDEAQE